MIRLTERSIVGLRAWIAADPRPVLLDGGLSTQLGATDISGPLWTARAVLEAPQRVQQAHGEFLQAGAEILITGSYQVSRLGFTRAGYRTADADHALRNSVALARAAVDRYVSSSPTTRTQRREPLVAASVGPYGAILHDGSEYVGNYGVGMRQLRDFHRERVDLLAQAEPDLLAIETIPDLREVTVLVEVLAEYPHLAATVSCTLRDAGHLSAGQRLEELHAFTRDQIVALGVNCCPPELVPAAVGTLRSVTTRSVIAYPNVGATWQASSERWIPREGITAEGLAAGHAVLAEPVADLVGGCCGTQAGDIAELRKHVEALRH
ncbi:MAG: homocysteine S-methyltransferase [Actinomycetales bacterium]